MQLALGTWVRDNRFATVQGQHVDIAIAQVGLRNGFSIEVGILANVDFADSVSPADGQALADPVNILKGNAIAEGFNETLDELRSISAGGKDYLDQNRRA